MPECKRRSIQRDELIGQSRDDRVLPVRLFTRQGLWAKGAPTIVHAYSLAGEKVMVWALPSPALATSLTERVARLYLVRPGRCRCVMLGGASCKAITDKSNIPLTWWCRFEPVISVQLQIAPPDLEDEYTGEYGWTCLRNWRRVVGRVGGYELTSVIMSGARSPDGAIKAPPDEVIQAPPDSEAIEAPAGFALRH